MDFWRVVEILNRRKWFIALGVLVTVLLTYGGTRLVGSKWQATVRFFVPKGSSLDMSVASPNGQPQSDAAEEDSGGAGAQSAKSQAAVYEAIVKSRAVLEPVLARMSQPDLPPNFLKGVEFAAVGPRLFELRVTDSNRPRAETYANALADRFEEVNHTLITDRARKLVRFLDEQTRDAEAKVKAAQARYDVFRSQHEVAGVEGHDLEGALTRLHDARQQFGETTDGLKVATAELRQLEATARQPSSQPVTVLDVSPDSDVLQLQSQLADANDSLAKLRQHYSDLAPDVRKAVAVRDDLAAKLKSASAKRRNVAGAPAAVALNPAEQRLEQLRQNVAEQQIKLARLQSDISTARGDISRYKSVGGPMAAMVSELQQRTEAAGALKARLNSARLAMDAAGREDPITIMDKASPYNPAVNVTAGRTTKLMVLAVLCALVGTAGIVVALDSVDRRLRTVKEAEIALPSRVVAAIPQPMGSVSYSDLARVTELQPHAIHSESFRFLGTHLLAHKPGLRSLMVLSAKAEQGSTTTLTNLAITLAQAGKRVMVVDANTRTAELHTVFGLENDFGFTDVVSSPDDQALERAIRQTSVPRLSVITSGPQPRNPWELFHSATLPVLSQKLHERADYVLYDTPSAAIFTDALNLAPVVDGAFLCVRALEPLTGAEQRMIAQLEQASVEIIGSVLTDVPAEVVEGYRNYQHYYQASASANGAVSRSEAVGPPVVGPALPPGVIDVSARSEASDRADNES